MRRANDARCCAQAEANGGFMGPFHPDNLEFRLDDNYQTRMVCGPPAHVSVYC